MLDTVWIEAEEPGAPWLTVVLHGLGDSVEGYRFFPRWLGLPWMQYVLVNAPDPYYSGFAWYDFFGDAQSGIDRSRRLLFELLDGLRQRGHRTEQTLLFGFSQGCLMMWEVGLRYPHRMAGLIGVSGYVHEPEQALREQAPEARHQRFLITHGTHDPLIPCNPVRETIQTFHKAGLQVEWHEISKAHTIDPGVERDLIRDFAIRVCRNEMPG